MAKSIIDIEVNDGAFNEFKSAFDKYNAALAKQPEAWSDVAKSATKSATSTKALEECTAALGAHVENLAKRQDKFSKATSSSALSMSKMYKSAKRLGGEIKGATESLLKWTGIIGTISGLIGGGGLFGINRMAADAAQNRFGAQGLGISTGELNSANINYRKAVADPAGTLAAIRDAQYDLSKRWAFSALGVNPAGKNADELLGPMIKAAKRTFAASGSTLQGAEARGLTQFFTMDDLTRFKQLSDAEIDAMVKRADADRRTLAVSDRTNRAWQDFNIQMGRSGTQIENTFIRGLVPLAAPLTKLSQAFSDAVADFMRSPHVGKWISELADGIQRAARYLKSDEFQYDLSNFADSLDDAAGAIYNFAQKIGKLFGSGEVTLKGSQYHKLNQISQTDPKLASALRDYLENPSAQKYNQSVLQRWVELHPGLNLHQPDFARTQSEIVQRFGLGVTASPAAFSANVQQATAPNAFTASRHNPGNLRNGPGSFAHYTNDAAGIRAMASLLRKYNTHGVNDIRDIVSKYAPPSDNNDTGEYIRNVSKRTGYSPDQPLNLSDNRVMAQLISAMTKQENSRSNYTPGTVVTILNNTGGNAIVTANQLAH